MQERQITGRLTYAEWEMLVILLEDAIREAQSLYFEGKADGALAEEMIQAYIYATEVMPPWA